MSDMGDMWREMREHGRKKKSTNLDNSVKLLMQKGVDIRRCTDFHYKIDGWDFWPSTGKFYNSKTAEKGRGVFNLIKKLKTSKV